MTAFSGLFSMLARLLLFCILLAAASQCSCARAPAHDRRRDVPSQAAKLVSRTDPATDELFFHTELGRGVCHGFKVAEKLLSSSTSAARHECRQTPGCTHVTRNVKTGETFLCSGFADVISNASDWVYGVRKTCGPWEKFLYRDWPGDLRESMCEKEFLGGCPAWTFSVREPWHTQPATCAICPPEGGCPVPKSLRHVDTLSKPLDRFAQSVGRDMKAMNPSVYVRDGKFSVIFRITNQTRCKLPEPVASDDTKAQKSFSSYVAHCELDSTTMAVRTDTLRILSYDDEVLSHTPDYENNDNLPFQGPEDCRAVATGSETSWMLCSKYTSFVEYTAQRKTSHEHCIQPNGRKDRPPQKQAQFEVKGARRRVFDVSAEQADTTRMALLEFDAMSSMRITGGVQFDVRFVDGDGEPNDDPELYKIMQKNWMLVPSESLSRLTFIVSSFPHSLATCDVLTATCTIRSYARREESAAQLGGQILKQWRGGSTLLPTEHGLLSVVHSRTYISTEAMYTHALALYSSHFPHRLISLSEPFRLPQPKESVAEESGIQFASGIEYDAQSDRLFIGYGHSDCSAELAVLHQPFTSIKWYKVPSEGEFSQAPRAPRGDVVPKPTHHASPGTTLVRVAGPVTSTYSLAEVNREFALAVAESGFDLTLRPANWGEKVDVLYKSARFGHLHRFLEKHLVDAARPAAITIYNNWPVQLFPPLHGQWVWNLAWEFQAIPLSWQEVMKKQEVTVWTPSTFTRDALLRAGVSPQKVKHVPHAVDADDVCLKPRSESRSSILQKEDAVDRALKSCSNSGADFIYLYHGAALWRKGLDVLLNSYSSAQPGLAHTCLIVHASYGDDEVYGLVAEHAVTHAIKNQNLVILTETLSKEELAKLFLSADAIVHPSRAEGFGLVAAQALACNKTLIVTADGATRDFATNETAFLVNGRYVECTKAPCSEIGLFNMEVTSKPTWFEPDMSSLVEAMAEARNNKLARRKRQAAGYELISKQFNRKNLHRRVQREILDLQNRDRRD